MKIGFRKIMIICLALSSLFLTAAKIKEVELRFDNEQLVDISAIITGAEGEIGIESSTTPLPETSANPSPSPAPTAEPSVKPSPSPVPSASPAPEKKITIKITGENIYLNGHHKKKEDFGAEFEDSYQTGMTVELIDVYAEHHVYLEVKQYLVENGIMPEEIEREHL